MGLADIMLGDGVLLGRRPPKVTTPPFNPAARAGAQAPPSGGAGPAIPQAASVAADPDTGMTANQAALQDALAHPPQEGMRTDGQPISKFRKIMGNIASVAGPMIGGPAVSGLGDKLLHPGMDDWKQKVGRLQQLAGLDENVLAHRDLQAQRQAMNDARDESRTVSEQNEIDRREGKGQRQIPLGSLAQKLVYQNAPTPQTGDPMADLPTASKAVLQPSLATGGAQLDPATGKPYGDAGDVDTVNKPGTKGADKVAMFNPSQATRSKQAADAAKLKREGELDAARTEELTPEMLQAATESGMKGLPKPGRVTPTVYNNFQTQMGEFGRLNKKPDKAANEDPNHWIATIEDPTASPADKEIAKKKMQRHLEMLASQRPVNETAATNLLDKQITRFAKPHEKALSDSSTQLEKIADARAMINGNASSQALGIPKLLTALVSGQGSGVRITQAELNSIASARGISGDVEGFFRKVSGAGALTPSQQQQITQILDDVRERIRQKQTIANEAIDAINSASSREEVIRHDKTARQKLIDMERGVTTEPQAKGGPAIGTIEDGHRYKGGNPALPTSWEAVQVKK